MTMGWLIKKGSGRKKIFSRSPKNIICPVCKGHRVIRVQPQELLPWDRSHAAGEHRIEYIETTCWACHGEGRVPPSQGDYTNGRFGD